MTPEETLENVWTTSAPSFAAIARLTGSPTWSRSVVGVG